MPDLHLDARNYRKEKKTDQFIRNGADWVVGLCGKLQIVKNAYVFIYVRLKLKEEH